jgi:hypothetical protein
MLAQAAADLVPCPLLRFHKRIEDMDTYNEAANETTRWRLQDFKNKN